MDEIRVCCGKDCTPRGSRSLMERICAHYGVTPGGCTHEVSVDFRECTGYCSIGPNVSVNGNIAHHVTPETAIEKIEHARTLPPATDALVHEVDLDAILNDDILNG